MRGTVAVIALCLLWIAPYRAVASSWSSLADTVFKTIAHERDMATSIVPLAFEEDRDGFLWGGGEGGLFRWDGYEFRFYSPSDTPKDGLHDHYVWALHRDRGGHLWVGTEAGGLAWYDAAADRFETVVLADRNGEANCVWSIDDDGEGGIWAGTNHGVAHLDANGHVVPPPAHADHAALFAVPNRKVEAVLQGRGGSVWIGGGDGMALLGRDGSIVPISLPAPGGTVPQVSRLMEDSTGRIWAGTRHHGAYVVDPASLQARAIKLPAGLVGQDGGVEVMAMEEVEPGRVWLGTFGQGLIDVTNGGMAVRSIVRDPFVQGTLDSDLIYGLHRDRSGTTWIATTEALDQFVPPAAGIHTLFGNPKRRGGLPTDVTAVLARPDGSVWLGSQNNGVAVLGPDGRLVRTLPIARVFCLAAEAEGNVYVGTRSGLFAVSPSGDSVRKVEIDARRENAGVFSLAAVDGVVWVGRGDDGGLLELHPGADGQLVMARQFGAPPLPEATVHFIAPAPDGLLAVGTTRGLSLIHRDSGAMESILTDPANPHSIVGGLISSAVTDQKGRLWVGSNDSGLAVMLRREASGKPVFRRVTTADGLPNADMNSMFTDTSGRIWIATDSGLAVVDSETFAVHALKEADGVAISTYWSQAGGKSPNGDLLFGGMGGLTVVEPDAVRTLAYQPPVVISDIHAGGKLVRQHGDRLVIAPEANSLSVEFSALDFSAPNRNIYRYRLENFDTDFVVTDSRHRVASYTNLPPGEYALRLQGSNRDGEWSAPVTLHIVVLPAWFQTRLFHLGEFFGLTLVCGLAMQGRTYWLRRRQRYLESLVHARTADLLEKTEELLCSQQKLTHMAYYDPLTALPNRRSFNEALQELLGAKKYLSGFVLIVIDLDGFKWVNDTLGHDAGDELLVTAADRLRDALRDNDFTARLGGDEFAILLRHTNDPTVVQLVCDRIVTGMMAPVTIKGEQVRIGASVGVALSPRHGRTAEDLYKHADEALYLAKRSGKGVWCVYAGQSAA